MLQPQQVVFGAGCAITCIEDVIASGYRRVFIVTSSPILNLVNPLADVLRKAGVSLYVYDDINVEPSIEMFEAVRKEARSFAPDIVIGIGGGSAMDVAKLAAALHDSDQDIQTTFGIKQLGQRRTHLLCLPTTSGTGSEVSPNAILSDPEQKLKRGIVSPYLVPDAAYIDPDLTITLPPALTASTGFDALTHCIEAYANVYAHPMVDVYALQGIRLIAANITRAVQEGSDIDARTAMALGSYYGGLCLSPVNTAAVHALAYPLGGEFHIPHGISNAVLLPHVIEFNLPTAPDRYAAIARILGVDEGLTENETAQAGLEQLRELYRLCEVPMTLSALGIPAEAIPGMAVSAIKVTRLLKNNLREVTTADAEAIYRSAMA